MEQQLYETFEGVFFHTSPLHAEIKLFAQQHSYQEVLNEKRLLGDFLQKVCDCALVQLFNGVGFNSRTLSYPKALWPPFSAIGSQTKTLHQHAKIARTWWASVDTKEIDTIFGGHNYLPLLALYIPNEVRSLPSLHTILLRNSHLAFIPRNLNFPNLTNLDLQNNQIKKLPDFYLPFPEPISLSLGRNLLSELPDSFADSFPQLQSLDLYRNKFTSIPNLRRLSHLTYVRLVNNPLSESFGLDPVSRQESTENLIAEARLANKLPDHEFKLLL